MAINIRINMRKEQQALYLDSARFCVRVCHRRMGKTWLAVAELFIDGLMTERNDWRGIYIGPTFKQTKRVAWDLIKQFVKDVPKVQVNEAELRVDLPNGSRIQLLGAETYDSLRGQYADKAVLDECQLIPSAAWTQVIRPMLADRQGTAVFMGTPAGRMNLLFDLLQYAESGKDPDWSAHVLPVTKTNILPQSEIDAMKREMSSSDFEQELLCSFNASIMGAYYAKEMAAVHSEGRATLIRYDAAAEVTAALDLGYSDMMVATFWQQVGTEHHAIAARGYQRASAVDVCNDWKSLPFKVDRVILPHDAKAHHHSMGKSTEEVFNGFYSDVLVNERIANKHDGIERVRQLLPHVWFDRDECATLIEALTQFRAEYDATRRVMKMKPVHDWASHWVDSVQEYAIGRPDLTGFGNWDRDQTVSRVITQLGLSRR